tara:strand:+ start:1940 stop:2350 length:411 start_codon:yes stop_codon:yes gene_type:complete
LVHDEQQISDKDLQSKAIEVLDKNPHPVRGPRTINGKMNALKNLRKRFPASSSMDLESDIYYSSTHMPDPKFQIKDCKTNMSKNQKKYFDTRFEYLVKNTKSVNVLNEFTIKSVVLAEIEMQRYFFFLNDSPSGYQ